MNSSRLLLFIQTNYLYLIGSFLYFILSSLLLGGRWWSFLLCFVLYVISILVALSPIGEWLMRVINNVRPVETKQEKEYLFPLFEDAYSTAKQNFPGLPGISLYIQDTMAVNACAINTHTVAVTKGAIETFSEEELKAQIGGLEYIRRGYQSLEQDLAQLGAQVRPAIISEEKPRGGEQERHHGISPTQPNQKAPAQPQSVQCAV